MSGESLIPPTSRLNCECQVERTLLCYLSSEEATHTTRGPLGREVINNREWIVDEQPTTLFHGKAEGKIVVQLSTTPRQTPIEAKTADSLAAEAHIDTLQNVDLAPRSDSLMMIADDAAIPRDQADPS